MSEEGERGYNAKKTPNGGTGRRGLLPGSINTNNKHMAINLQIHKENK